MANSMEEIMNPSAAKAAGPSFPFAPAFWTERNAKDAAREQGLKLDDDHWDTVRALQEYYGRHEGSVQVRELQDALDERFHSRGGIKYLYQLFPGGPVVQGCLLAGLEPPAGAADKGFGSVM